MIPLPQSLPVGPCVAPAAVLRIHSSAATTVLQVPPFGEGRCYQNSNPVASQFRADPKPREAVHREDPPRDPFSPSFKRTLAASGANLRRVSSLVNHTAPSAASSPSGVQEGQTIEHERFGIGTVVKLEGTGENQKATVEFRNSGTKQLLLKFARFKIIS